MPCNKIEKASTIEAKRVYLLKAKGNGNGLNKEMQPD